MARTSIESHRQLLAVGVISLFGGFGELHPRQQKGVYNCGGVKLLGARHTTVVGNSFRVPVNYAVFIGAAGGEGLRVSEDILITANNITDLLTADQAGAAVDYNVGILIYQFSYLPHNVIVRGNNLAQRTAGTDGLTWSQIKPRGIAGENRQWRRDTPTGNVMFYDTTMTGEVFIGRASAMRIEAPNALDRLTYDVDENRIDGFSEDDFVRSQSAAWDGAPELWAVPASAGEFPIEAARFAGLDLRGYQQMRLVLNVGGQAGLTGTILYYRYSLDGGATWYDTDAAIQLDDSTNQAFWGNWQPIPPMLRQSIDTTVALFGRDGDGSTVVELVDWFVLDIRGVDHTSAARLAAAAGDAGGDRRSGRDRAAQLLAEGHRRHRRGADPVTARPADQSGTSYSRRSPTTTASSSAPTPPRSPSPCRPTPRSPSCSAPASRSRRPAPGRSPSQAAASRCGCPPASRRRPACSTPSSP